MPTGIWSSRLRSGSAHCDLQLAVEVRQCPLGSGARGGWDLDCEEEAAGQEAEEAEAAEAEEEENSSEKIWQPSPGRWGTSFCKSLLCVKDFV